MQSNLLEILALLIIAESLLFSIFLFASKKGKRQSNVLLGGIMFNLVISFGYDLLMRFGLIWNGINFGCALIMLYGPMLYFYTRSVCYRAFQLERRFIKHLFPHAVILLFLLASYLAPAESTFGSGGFRCLTAQWLSRGHFLIYILLSWKTVMKFPRQSESPLPANQGHVFTWLKFLVIISFVVLLVSSLRFSLPLMGHPALEMQVMPIEFVLIFILVNTCIYIGLSFPSIFVSRALDQPSVKYASSKLAKETALDFKTRLLGYMENEKPYLNDELTARHLADALSTTVKNVSQVLNEFVGQSFHDFVNGYRIRHAKHLLEDQGGARRINEVMYASGFRSKSTFNHLFKKQVGMTPKDYKSRFQGKN